MKRLDALRVSYVHTVVLEIINKNDMYVEVYYYTITTSTKTVDYGGVNKFKTLFLYL